MNVVTRGWLFVMPYLRPADHANKPVPTSRRIRPPLLADNETTHAYPQVECIDTPPFLRCVLAGHPETRWLLADNENSPPYPQVECIDTPPFLRCVLAGHPQTTLPTSR